MAKVNCTDCKNWSESFRCKYQFRGASDAGGRSVECHEDVWFCQDYDEKTEEDQDD